MGRFGLIYVGPGGKKSAGAGLQYVILLQYLGVILSVCFQVNVFWLL